MLRALSFCARLQITWSARDELRAGLMVGCYSPGIPQRLCVENIIHAAVFPEVGHCALAEKQYFCFLDSEGSNAGQGSARDPAQALNFGRGSATHVQPVHVMDIGQHIALRWRTCLSGSQRSFPSIF